MAITTTANKNLIKVTVGTESGTWGPYVNSNEDLLDNMLGGTATIALTNSPVTLSSAQYQCAFIRFTGAITADIPITFPPVGSFYTVINDTTNSSNFNLTVQTSVPGGRAIGIPPGDMTEILTDGSNARLIGLPPVGAYWDYAGSSVPRWVSACTIPPWVYCNGGSFSSAAYPALTAVLQGTVLPDLRGRIRGNYNDGTGRITTAGGVDGNILFASGGVQAVTLSSQNIPNYALPVTDPGHIHTYNVGVGSGSFGVIQAGGGAFFGGTNSSNTGNNTTGITVNSGGSGNAFQILPPLVIGGITMIRAA